MNKFSFPIEINEMKNYISNNFKAEDFSKVYNDIPSGHYIFWCGRDAIERSIKYCIDYVNFDKKNRNCNKSDIAKFYEKYSNNESVFMILWGLFIGITCEELYSIVTKK